MDSNKDDALRCIQVAEKYIKEKNKEKAEKFLQKAERLYPTQKAKDLLLQVSIMPDTVETEEQPRRRKEVPVTSASPKKAEYTADQLSLVKRIRACKDYYEILCISKDATDSEIKKAYKKIALQLHPDKNRAPGADEAFKAVGNAVSVLTDPEKRKQYDLYGNEEDRPARNHSYNYNRGFEAEVNPEELFNMFFGSGFGGSNVYVRRGGRWQRQTAGSQQEHRHREPQQGNMSAFVQLLPIIIAILLSMASSFFISDPAYSLSVSSKYPIMRRTHNLQVPYYVKDNFHSEYQGSVKRLELSVEEEYVTNLRHQCYREKSYRDSMIWKARNFGDQELYNNAQNLKMPSCEALQKLRVHGTL